MRNYDRLKHFCLTLFLLTSHPPPHQPQQKRGGGGVHTMYAVYTANRNVESERFASVKKTKENTFCVAKQMRRKNQDVTGEKCI